MKSFTQKLLLSLIVLVAFFAGTVHGQSVLNPADSVYTYDSTKAKGSPQNPTVTNSGLYKWIRTVRVSYNTQQWKCYLFNSVQFRLLYPKSYNPTANDGKKYPIIIFWHGAGEIGPQTDNEISLAHGGQPFMNAINNGTYDGYVLVPQTPVTYWSTAVVNSMDALFDYMTTNNKLDPFRIVTNGLSMGGQASWAYHLQNPQYTAANLPMSANNTGNSTAASLALTKFTPIWTFSGGLDNDPDPTTAATVNTQEQAAGANYLWKLYTTLGHDTWDSAWEEPNFYPFVLAAYGSNPWGLNNHISFCPGTTISEVIGVAPNMSSYKWRKNGNIISGATTNSLTVTDTGTYDCQVTRGSFVSDWSHTPLRISFQTPTVSPTISVAGLMSDVIPALDNNYVNIKVPSGYGTYNWQKVGSSTTIGTDSVLTVTSPGQYTVQVVQPFGCTSAFAAPFTVINAAGTPKPDAATGLTATAVTNTVIALNWNQNPNPMVNETSFEVYQGSQSGGPYKLIAIMGQNVVTDTVKGLLAGTKYYYVVRPVCATGAAVSTNEASATTPSDVTPPTAPASLTITGSSATSITVTWTQATDNVGVVGYDIYVNGSKAYSVASSASAPDTVFTIYGLTHKQTYAITVKARDLAGNVSTSSPQVSGEALINGLNYSYYDNLPTTISVLPNFPTLTPKSTGVMANVSIANATDLIDFAYLWTGYIIIPTTGTYTFQTTSDDGSAMWLGSLNGSTSPYSYTGTPTVNNNFLQGATSRNSTTMTLQAGVYPIAYAYFQQGGGYSMTIQWQTPASGGSFVTIPNSAFSETAAVNGTAPAYPTNETATAVSYKSINLTWTDNSNNETGFEVSRSTSLNGVYAIVGTTKANTTSYVDSGLQASTAYYYKIQAVNTYGGSGYDPNSVSGLTYNYYNGYTYNNLATLPSLTPTSTGILTNVSLSPATATTNFAFKFSGYINIKKAGSYTFYTSSDDGSDMYVGGFDSAHLVVKNDFLQGQTQRSGTVTLAVGRYPVYVTYFQQGGGYALTTSWQLAGASLTAIPDSAYYGNPPTATTLPLPTIPSVPTGLTVNAASSSVINVSWSDTATNVVNFLLYRSATTDQAYVLLATLSPTTFSYKDTALFANAKYYYKVNAVNAGGASAFAPESSATTLDVPPVIAQISNQQARYGMTTVIPVSATFTGSVTLAASNLPAFAVFADNGNGTGKITLNPAHSDSGTYNGLTVKATDGSGGTSQTQFSLWINNNFAPTINTISNYSMNEGDSLVIPLVGQDVNPADTLTYVVTNVPSKYGSSYYIKQQPSGTGTLVIKPGFAAAGTYAVQVTLNDNNGLSATQTFTLTIISKVPQTTIYTRVKYQATAPAPWNNLSGPTTTNLLDQSGNATTVGVAFNPTSWWSPYNGGPTTGNNSGVYPDVVLQEYYYFGFFNGPANPTIVVSGLDTTKRYDLTFFASSVLSGIGDNGVTSYSAQGQTVTLEVQDNLQNTVVLDTLKPASNGTITVTMGKVTSYPPGYLNALVIQNHFVDSLAPAPPNGLQAALVSKGVGLNWTDIAYNAKNYQVFRSTKDSLHYTQIATLPANSTSYTDTSSLPGNSQCYYKIDAINANGTSAYSNQAGVVTADRIPVVTAIPNVTVYNNNTATVTVTAIDDPTDHLTLTATGLPQFASFVDNGNGTGTVNITPTPGLQGTFPGVTITATDMSDSSRSASFTINVVDSSLDYTYLNFTNTTALAPAPWNNLQVSYIPYAGTAYVNLADQVGKPTGITVTLTDQWSALGTTGMKRRNGSDLYPESVSGTSIYANDANNRRITVTGLNPALQYNFQFFISHFTSESTLTNFTVNGQTVSLNGSQNSNKTAQINGITSDNTGTVVINCIRGTGGVYAMLSSLVIESYTPGGSKPFAPADLRKLDFSKTGTIALQWQDRASNETGYEVWRAPHGGTYTLLKALPANSTTYVDSALPANTAYDYTVRVVNGTQYSAYSNPVEGYTYAGSVFVFFNRTWAAPYSFPSAPAPFNNLNWSYPSVGNVWNNFTDENALMTNVGLVEPETWDEVDPFGASTGNNSGVFPDAAMGQGWLDFPGDTSYVTITNLDQSKLYDITMFASCTDDPTANASGRYRINGQSGILNAHLNTSGTLTFFGIAPDAYGNVSISVKAYDSSNSSYAILGNVSIKGYTPSSGSVSPTPTQEVAGTEYTTGAQFNNSALTDSVPVQPLSAYPNPFTGSFTLSVPAHEMDNIVVTMTDVSGRTVYKAVHEGLVEGTNLFRIDAPAGTGASIYFVQVIFTNRDERQVMKVIKTTGR
jgi:fibronectin type 3 domain-containing protein